MYPRTEVRRPTDVNLPTDTTLGRSRRWTRDKTEGKDLGFTTPRFLYPGTGFHPTPGGLLTLGREGPPPSPSRLETRRYRPGRPRLRLLLRGPRGLPRPVTSTRRGLGRPGRQSPCSGGPPQDGVVVTVVVDGSIWNGRRGVGQ